MGMHMALGYIADGTMASRSQIVRHLSLYAWDVLTSHGWHTTSPRGSHILILPIGYSDLAASLQQWCFKRGVAFALIGHPAVPQKFKLGFRLCINASMTKEDIDDIVRVL